MRNPCILENKIYFGKENPNFFMDFEKYLILCNIFEKGSRFLKHEENCIICLPK